MDNIEIKTLEHAGVVLEQLELFFQRQLLTIRAVRSATEAHQPISIERNYAGWDKKTAMRDLLKTVNAEVTDAEIAEQLERAGCDMGADGLKNIRITASMNSDVFYRNSGRIGLVVWKERSKVA